MTIQTASHDHTTAYLLLTAAVIIVLSVGGVWFFAS